MQPKAALYAADIVGGLILGAGIALAGACPGTTLAQVGVGYRDALFTLVGGLCGAVAYSYAQPALSKTFLGSGGGKLIFTDLLEFPIGWARWCSRQPSSRCCSRSIVAPWRDEIGKDVDGNLPPQPGASRPHLAPAE